MNFQEVITTFSNREIATTILITFFLIYSLTFEEVRENFRNILKCLFNKFIILLISSIIFYSFIIVSFLKKIHFWDSSMIKDTIIWIIFSGFIYFFSGSKTNIFKMIIKESIRLSLILEFIFNSFNFSIILEIFLGLIITFLEIVKLTLKKDKRFFPLFDLFDKIEVSFLIFILFNIGKNLIFNSKEFFNILNLKCFFLPIILSFSFIPLLYLFFLIIGYEALFKRLSYGVKKSRKIKFQATLMIFKKCHLNLKKVETARNMGIYNLMNLSTIEDIRAMEKIYSKAL